MSLKSDLTFLDHANFETFLKTAILTAIPATFVHHTVLRLQTNVLGILLNSSLETDGEKVV